MSYSTIPLDDLFFDPREFDSSICADCNGASPTVEQMRRQFAESGDISGACARCDNAHAEPTDAPSGYVPYGSAEQAAAMWSIRTGRPCPVTARWCSCGHDRARQGKPIDRCASCGGFCEGSEWR